MAEPSIQAVLWYPEKDLATIKPESLVVLLSWGTFCFVASALVVQSRSSGITEQGGRHFGLKQYLDIPNSSSKSPGAIDRGILVKTHGKFWQKAIEGSTAPRNQFQE
jgi:hypothetical protein